jgi:OmpA-OmpF porin, OOP family
MKALRTLLCLTLAGTAAFWLPAQAQLLPGAPATAGNTAITAPPPQGVWLPGGRSYLGLNLGRSRSSVACSSTALTCDDSFRSTQFYTGTMLGNFWGVELAYADTRRLTRAAGEPREGLTLSLVGRTQLAPSLGLYGKLGTNYGRNDSSAFAAARAASALDRGFGLSFGAGLSYDFTPRLSATLQWDTTEPLSGGARDPVRSTSLGLKYRY